MVMVMKKERVGVVVVFRVEKRFEADIFVPMKEGV